MGNGAINSKRQESPVQEKKGGWCFFTEYVSTALIILFVLFVMHVPKAGGENHPAGVNDPQLPPFAHINKTTYLKKRAEYVAMLRGWRPGRPFNTALRLKALRQMKAQRLSLFRSLSEGSYPNKGATASNVSKLPAWMPIGPAPVPNGQTDGVTNPVSGRVTAIAVHPTNPDIVYVGTAQGGVYRTLDGGATWTAIFDSAESLSIGAVTIDPVNPGIVFVGTGEGNSPGGGGCFFGVGIYRIDDADTSPVLNGPFDTRVAGTWTSAGNGHAFLGTSITRIVVDPNNDNRIFVGNTIGGFGNSGSGDSVLPGSSNPADAFVGLYFCPNALSASPTFSRIALPSSAGYSSNGYQGVTDIVLAPDSSDDMVVGVADFYSDNSALSGIYTTNNASAASQGSPGAIPSFTFVVGSLGSQQTGNPPNTKLAVNKVGSTVTVLAATNDSASLDSSGNPLGQLYESTDGGASFHATLTSADGFCGQQCFYDNAVAIDPGDPNNIYLGGMSGYGSGSAMNFGKSTNGGASFAESDMGLHTDTHAIAVAPSNPAVIYTGNDGGIFKSTDYGATWTSLNNSGFSATQFQSLALHPIDQHFLIGGTQDNGTNWYKPDATWFRVDYGDGGFCAIDQNAADTTNVRMYHTYYNEPYGLIGYGAVGSVASATDGNWIFYGCQQDSNDDCSCNNGLSCWDNVLFYPPIALGPGNPNTLYFGTDTLYRSSDGGLTMTAVSQAPLDTSSDSPISSIGISPQDDRVRMVGLQNGRIFYTTIGSKTLISLKPSGAGGLIPDNYVTRTVIDPGNKYTAYVTLAAYSGGTAAWQSHIFKVTDLNNAPHIEPINGTAPNELPDVPIGALAADINDPAYPGTSVLYAGTDIGVYQSVDGGANWIPFGTGLPRVAVFDMAIHGVYRTLRVATYGRGLWEIALPESDSPAIFSVAGTVKTPAGKAVPGVTVTLGGNAGLTTTTNSYGRYKFTGLDSMSFIITPAKPGYSFTPAVKIVHVNGSDVTDVDFTGATYFISGTVKKPGGAGIPNVLMTLSGAADVTVYTDSSGNFGFTKLADGNYTITPGKPGVTFTPHNKTVDIGGANMNGQDFTGTK
jgi:hypothetical protein